MPSAIDAIGSNDKSLGGWSHKIERVTGNKSQRLLLSGLQDFDVVWFNDLCGDDFVLVRPVKSREVDRVVLPDQP